MAHELEAAAVDVLGARRPPREGAHAAAPGSPCANCGTALQGPWCHACGQLGEDFHRSAWRLVGESVEGILHLDARVWRTVGGLVLRPSRLTRAYLEGHRAPQIPPLRLFLVVLLAVFLVGGMATGRSHSDKVRLAELSPAQRAEVDAALSEKVAAGKIQTHSQPGPPVTGMKAVGPGYTKLDLNGLEKTPAGKWLVTRTTYAQAHPEELKLIMEQWSERFAFMLLPLGAGMMSLLFVFQRRFFLFDHLIFTMHSLSFLGLMITVSLLVSMFSGLLGGLLYFTGPVHLFMHMRGVYRTSVLGTLLRMWLLFVGSVIGFALLMVGLVAVGLAGLHA